MTLPRTQTSESAPSALLLHRIFETIGIDHQATQAFLRLYPDGSHDLSALFIRFSTDQLALQSHIQKELEAPNNISFSPSDGLRLSLLHRWFLLQAPNKYPWRQLNPKFRDELHRHRFAGNTNIDVSSHHYAKSYNSFLDEDDKEWDSPMCITTKDYDDIDVNRHNDGDLLSTKYIDFNCNDDNHYDSHFDINNDSFYSVISIDTSSSSVFEHATDHKNYIDKHDDSPFIHESHHYDHYSTHHKDDDDTSQNTLDLAANIDETILDSPGNTRDNSPFFSGSHFDNDYSTGIRDKVYEYTSHNTLDFTAAIGNRSFLLDSLDNTRGTLVFTDSHNPPLAASPSCMDHHQNTQGHNNGHADTAPLLNEHKHGDANKVSFITYDFPTELASPFHPPCMDVHVTHNLAMSVINSNTDTHHYSIATTDDTITQIIPCRHSDFNMDTNIPCHAEDLPITCSESDQYGTNVMVDTSSNNPFSIDSETPFIKIFTKIGLSTLSIDFISTCLFPDGFDDLQVFFELYADDETELENLLTPLLGCSDTHKIITLHRWYLQSSTTPLDWSTFISSLSLDYTHLQSPFNDNNCISFSLPPALLSGVSYFGPHWICGGDSVFDLDIMTPQKRLNASNHTALTPISQGKQASRNVFCSKTDTDAVAVNANFCGPANCIISLDTAKLDTSNAILTVSNPPPLNSACNQHLSQLTTSPNKESRISNTQFATDWHKGDDSCTARAALPQHTPPTDQIQANIKVMGHFRFPSCHPISDKIVDANNPVGTLENQIVRVIGYVTNAISDCAFGNALANIVTHTGNNTLSVFADCFLNQENYHSSTASADHDWMVFLPDVATGTNHSPQPYFPSRTTPLAQQHVGFIPSSIKISYKTLNSVLSALEMAANHTAWHTNISPPFDWTLVKHNLNVTTMDLMIDNVPLVDKTDGANIFIQHDANYRYQSTLTPNNHFVHPPCNSIWQHRKAAQFTAIDTSIACSTPTFMALECKMTCACTTLPVQWYTPISFGFIPHKPSLPPDNTTGTNTIIVPHNIFPTHHPNIRNPTITFALRMDTTSHQLTTNSNNNELKNNIPFDSLGTTTEMIAPTCNSRPTFEFGLPLTILKGKLIPRVYNFMRHIFIDGKDGRATATTTAFARIHNILQQELNAFLTIG